jgi:hypothetical protein
MIIEHARSGTLVDAEGEFVAGKNSEDRNYEKRNRGKTRRDMELGRDNQSLEFGYTAMDIVEGKFSRSRERCWKWRRDGSPKIDWR